MRGRRVFRLERPLAGEDASWSLIPPVTRGAVPRSFVTGTGSKGTLVVQGRIFPGALRRTGTAVLWPPGAEAVQRSGVGSLPQGCRLLASDQAPAVSSTRCRAESCPVLLLVRVVLGGFTSRKDCDGGLPSGRHWGPCVCLPVVVKQVKLKQAPSLSTWSYGFRAVA